MTFIRRGMEKMSNSKISIIIPCYNIERYIEHSIESVLMQSYTNFEIICIDDGSKDSTVEVIKKYLAKDPRIYLLQQENQYAGVARNKGMEIATGEYIFFLDGDDYLKENALELLLNKAEITNADMVLCDAYFYDNQNGYISEPSYVLNREVLKKVDAIFCAHDIPHNIFELCWSVPWNKLYRREFIENNGLRYQSIKRHNDEYFNTLALVLAQKIAYVEERVIVYRRNLSNSLQAYNQMDEIDFSIYDALYGIHEKLNEIDIEGEYKLSFRNKCLVAMVNILKRQKSYENYRIIYEKIKSEWIYGLDIAEIFDTNYKSYQRQLLQIEKLTPEEYIFNKYVEIEEIKKSFSFPFDVVGSAERIVIYAAGKKGKSFYGQLIENDSKTIVAWVDRVYEKYAQRGLPVTPVESIKNKIFDYVVIAIDDFIASEGAKDYLLSIGIPAQKIITTERKNKI